MGIVLDIKQHGPCARGACRPVVDFIIIFIK